MSSHSKHCKEDKSRTNKPCWS
ncbi:hypothetical protein V12B01_13535 [Vibrio splendidus 12B01]|nr:hypothetical protein V12B01_13535 [Vibrio splendidus 12B01]